MFTPARKANSRWRGSPGTKGNIGCPSARIAQAPAKSLEVIKTGETPSPQRLGRRRRAVGDDRPVNQWKERQLVAAEVDPDRLAGFERRPLRQKQRQSLQSAFAHRVDIGIAGQNVGEPGLKSGLFGKLVS